MIDDYAKAMELMRQMEAQLPIPARPTGVYVRALRKQGVKVTRDQELQIKRVFYLGDEGGIACDVPPSRDTKQAIVVSITHLRVDPRHPLAHEIRTYQRERTRRLAQSGRSGKPSRFRVRPHKKRQR